MKQLLCLFLALSLTACAAGPRTVSASQTVLAAEDHLTASDTKAEPHLEAEHDPSGGLPREEAPAQESSPSDTAPEETASPDAAPEEEADAAPERVVDPSRPMVALTFDDGPHPEFTDQILDILEENQAVATFFEVATNLHKDPDAVRRAADMGCEIGSHSYRHANLGKMDAEAIQADLAAADELFVQVLGQAPTLLRPPYGSMNQALKTTSNRTLVTWSIDPQDWLSKDAGKVVSHVQSFDNLDGQVILLHSIYGSTVEATRILVPWLLEQGYQLVTVSELLTLRFQQEIQTNHLYGYTFFQSSLPPLPTATTGENTESLAAAPVADTPVKVKLVLRESVPGETAQASLLRDLYFPLRPQPV